MRNKPQSAIGCCRCYWLCWGYYRLISLGCDRWYESQESEVRELHLEQLFVGSKIVCWGCSWSYGKFRGRDTRSRLFEQITNKIMNKWETFLYNTSSPKLLGIGRQHFRYIQPTRICSFKRSISIHTMQVSKWADPRTLISSKNNWPLQYPKTALATPQFGVGSTASEIASKEWRDAWAAELVVVILGRDIYAYLKITSRDQAAQTLPEWGIPLAHQTANICLKIRSDTRSIKLECA